MSSYTKHAVNREERRAAWRDKKRKQRERQRNPSPTNPLLIVKPPLLGDMEPVRRLAEIGNLKMPTGITASSGNKRRGRPRKNPESLPPVEGAPQDRPPDDRPASDTETPLGLTDTAGFNARDKTLIAKGERFYARYGALLLLFSPADGAIILQNGADLARTAVAVAKHHKQMYRLLGIAWGSNDYIEFASVYGGVAYAILKNHSDVPNAMGKIIPIRQRDRSKPQAQPSAQPAQPAPVPEEQMPEHVADQIRQYMQAQADGTAPPEHNPAINLTERHE